MLYKITFSWETRHTPIHPRQEAHDTTKVQLGESMSFIGVTYKSMVKDYLQEQKLPKYGTSPKPTRAHVTAYKAGNLAHPTHPTDSSAGWRGSLPNGPVDLSLSQAALLFSASSMQLVWS